MTKTYVVTKKAGKRVAGYVVKPGDQLKLTDAQAAYEKALGTIEELKAPKPKDP